MILPKPVEQFLFGLQLSVKGCICALGATQVWVKHKQCYTVLLSIILCLYLVCFLLYIPFFIMVYIASFLIDVNQYLGDTTFQNQSWLLFSSVSFYIPLVIVFVTQYLLPSFSDDVFFAALNTLEPQKSQNYQLTTSIGFWSIWWLRIRRFLRLSTWSFVAYLLSLIPYVGWMVFPVAQFYLISKIFGKRSAGVISIVLLIVPSLHPLSWPLLRILLGARALAIEVLEPYFSRFGYEKIKLVEKHHQPILLGFAVPFLVLMSVPILGPLFYGLVQASAAVLLVGMEL